MSVDQPGPPPQSAQGYPSPSGQPGFPPPGQGFPPPGDGFPPPPGGYPPPQQQGMSGLAITGFILSFLGGLLGLILSVIAIFQTGKGKKRGRGLAIAGVVISLIWGGVYVAIAVAASKSTLIDPGCTTGKAAIVDNATDITPAKVQATIDGLNKAAGEAKHDNVRDAMKTMADDYTQLLNAVKTGKVPDGLQTKINTDAAAIDDLCTLGS
ncbi:hypothetical protein HH310_10650 [Actinoplanes sp. TBRC 11911]|uniref:hypothetical protein n=1 Tax=Actinoplanes sp. TBRC 11911 TaxID=2729386 RepID=UPI00145CEBAF|nr:hypothetical protein [Actinoplanes sp. TBRC 11911]NMO51647.1 hypothetical protein [Actinoplanes sp. TBRC 11911]